MSAVKANRRSGPKHAAPRAPEPAPPAHAQADSFLSPSAMRAERHEHRSARDTPFSLKGIVIDVCRRNGFDPAEVMRPYPPKQASADGSAERPVQEDAVPAGHRAHGSVEAPHQAPMPAEPRRPVPVDRSGAAAMARAVCSMDDDTFWIVYLALSVEYERRFGEAGLARKVAANRSPHPGEGATP